MITKIVERIKTDPTQKYLLIGASAVFMITQFTYSWLMWHRAGNLPPTPADSYNYLVNIHQIAVGHDFFSDPRQFVYGGFNYLYALVALTFRLSPLAVYHLFFYVGKVILLGGLLYFLSSFVKNNRLLALIILALSVYPGTGETHGFFWVVPSFWSVVTFLVLVGMAMRQVAFLPIVIIAILFMFIHPLSIYATVPIILAYLVLRLLSSADRNKFGRLAVIMLLAVVIQQMFLYRFNTSNNVGQLSQITTVAGNGIGAGVSPTGESVQQKSDATGHVRIGILTFGDILTKLRSSEPSSEFSLTINVPKSIYRIAPGLYELWNAYGFFFASLPVPVLVFLSLLVMMVCWGVRKKDSLIVLFATCFLTTVGATIHPQGFRFLVFLWPLTIASFTYYLWTSTSSNLRARVIVLVVISVFSLLQLGYGLFMTSRVGSYRDYRVDRSCSQNILDLQNKNSKMWLFYSGATLAPTVFVGEGLYTITAVDLANWESMASQPDSKEEAIIFLNDRIPGYGPAGTIELIRNKATNISTLRGKRVEWIACGDFEYGKEQ